MSNLDAARRAAEDAARQRRLQEQQQQDYRVREAANAAFKRQQALENSRKKGK